MTEKRFECYDLILDGFIKDTLTNENIAEPIQLIHLLNELHEEKEQLKQQLKTKHIVTKQYEELQRLKKDNKELEKENDTLRMITGKELFKEIDYLKEDIQQLEKEKAEAHDLNLLASGFLIENGLAKEFLEWSKEND